MSDNNTDAQALIKQSLDTANAHLEQGDFEGATKLYKHVLEIVPNHHETMFMWALAANGMNDEKLSEQLIKNALRITDKQWEYHVHLGNLLHQQERFPRAEKSYRKALELNGDIPEALYGIANVKFRSGKNDKALMLLKELTEKHPNYPSAKKMIGTILFITGKTVEGANILQEAVDENPNDIEALGNLSTLYNLTAQHEKAKTTYRQLLKLNPENVSKRCEFANILQCLGEVDEAVKIISSGMDIIPDDLNLIDQYGILKLAQNDVEGAIEEFKMVLAKQQDNPGAHAHLGMAYLAMGNYAEGWTEYEWRLKDPNYPAEERNFPRPIWDGSDQKDASLLLYTEQGAGDTIQFVRFIKIAREKVGNIILACRPGLDDMLEGIEGVDTLITEGNVPDFQLHLPLMSLPRVLGITLDNLPSDTPYISAKKDLSSKWKKKLAKHKGLKVGLVTSGSPAQKVNPLRTIDPKLIEPLCGLEGVTLLSLQKTPDGFDAPLYPKGVTSLSDDLKSYSDTIAAIDNLDVVVTVCTSVAHLAGAMGKPTFIMLSKSADWRWMIDRDDSPWYPTAKLFRQTKQNEWADVIENIKAELEDMK